MNKQLKMQLEKAPHKRIFSTVKTMNCTLLDSAFNDSNWIFETKYDGYRAVGIIKANTVDLRSRSQKLWNNRFPSITKALRSFDNKIVVDGEIVAVNQKGEQDFQLLQNRQHNNAGDVYYYLFDILWYDGKSLLEIPLKYRKELLKSQIPEHNLLRYAPFVKGEGKKELKKAADRGEEGIVAKEYKSTYKMGSRSRQWLKIKTKNRQELIICGYTPPEGERECFGALISGVYEGNSLLYAGKIGTGFSNDDLHFLFRKMKTLKRKTSPFDKNYKFDNQITFLTPKLICEAEFEEWTDDGKMRHPAFKGLRDDKKPENVVRELPE